jgi:AraC-like DNA-binding protein
MEDRAHPRIRDPLTSARSDAAREARDSERHWTCLFKSPTLTIGNYRCRPHGAAAGPEETSRTYDVVLPRSGVFVKQVRGEKVVADVNQVVFFNRGETYRVSHPVCGGDDCTTFSLNEPQLRQILGEYDPSAMDRSERLFSVTHAPTDGRAFLLQTTLLRALGNAPTEVLAAEEIAFDLLDTIFDTAFPRNRSHGPGHRARTARAHRDLVHATRLVLNELYAQRLVLDDIGRRVHCSPYHLCRLFKRATGMPIHRYVNRLRLRTALELMSQAGQDLTTIALTVGYYDHSHFSNAFRREFGFAPSRLSCGLGGSAIREMSTSLQV